MIFQIAAKTYLYDESGGEFRKRKKSLYIFRYVRCMNHNRTLQVLRIVLIQKKRNQLAKCEKITVEMSKSKTSKILYLCVRARELRIRNVRVFCDELSQVSSDDLYILTKDILVLE